MTYIYIYIYSPHIISFPTKTIYDPITPPQGHILYILTGLEAIIS